MKRHSTPQELAAIWRGTSSKKTYTIYFCLVMAIYLLGIVVGASFYPGGFSIRTVYVSYLGGNEENPDGYLFYNTCVVITGILLIPHFAFLYRRLGDHPKLLNGLVVLFGVLGAVGFSLVGVYHQGIPGDGHSITTWLAFGGFGGSAVLLLFVFLRKKMLLESYPSWGQILGVYGVVLGILTVTILFDSFPKFFQGLGIPGEYTGDRFLEWFYLFIVISWLVGVLVITPDRIQKRQNSQ